MPTVTNFEEKKPNTESCADGLVSYEWYDKHPKTLTRTEGVSQAYHHVGPTIFTDIAIWIRGKQVKNKTEENELKCLLFKHVNTHLGRIPRRPSVVC